MSAINSTQVQKVKRMYYDEGCSMQKISDDLNVSIDAVTYFMRKNKMSRRSFKDAQAMSFKRKEPSFSKRPSNHKRRNKELEAMGAMLYWAEGYDTPKASGIDFANSDPYMISVFIFFLRSRYILDEKKFRPAVYCYSNQNPKELVTFWSRILNVPEEQFIKPYVRKDYRENGRTMKYGLVHIRYHDKKLLMDVHNLIESYKSRYSI